MNILVINPAVDIPDKMINGAKEYVERYLGLKTHLEFRNIKTGFKSIETETQGIINGAEILKVLMSIDESKYDGVFINCFDDPAVVAARELLNIPIMGPYEASVHIASMVGERIAIITTDSYGLICEERKACAHRYSDLIYKVVDIDLSVLELTDEKLISKMANKITELEKEGIGTAIFGCTGMNYIVEGVETLLERNNSKVKIIEPMRTGITALEYMINQGFNNSINSTPIKKKDFIEAQ